MISYDKPQWFANYLHSVQSRVSVNVYSTVFGNSVCWAYDYCLQMWLHNSFMMIIMSCLHDFWYYVLMYETTIMSWYMILQVTTHIVDYHNKCNVVGTLSCCYTVSLNKGSILHWSCIRAVAWTQTPNDCITSLRIKISPWVHCTRTQCPPPLSQLDVMHVYVNVLHLKWS